MLRRLERLDLQNEIQQSLIDTRDVYIAQQKDQMVHGKNKNGTLIGKYRNPAYAAQKFSQNSLAGFRNVDLKLTGAFHRGIFVEVRDDELIIFSEDKKAGMLEDKYGDEIFGLSKKYKIPFVDANRIAFYNRIKNLLRIQTRELQLA
jgi:hypothetical protein